MRHRKKGKTLDRKKAAREALLKNQTASLFIYGKIKTTQAKAKALASLVEKIITTSKNNTLTSRRRLLSKLFSREVVNKILTNWGPRYKARGGGYTRIVKLGRRKGDAAEIVQIELI